MNTPQLPPDLHPYRCAITEENGQYTGTYQVHILGKRMGQEQSAAGTLEFVITWLRQRQVAYNKHDSDISRTN